MAEKQSPLFGSINEEEYQELVACGGVRRAEYPRGAVLLHTGDKTREFGILQEGEIHIENIDVWGTRLILHSIGPGQSFAETYAICGEPLMVDVTAARNSRVLFVDLGVLLTPENQGKAWYLKLLQNLLVLSTRKNLAWSHRMFCITSKSIRDRVMTYLSAEAVRRGTMEFVIPFNRQQMADYLNVERSALSKELGRMQQEGILTFRKNHFHLLRTGADAY